MSGTMLARCSFCGEIPSDRRRLVESPSASICADCARICWEIVCDRSRRLGLWSGTGPTRPSLPAGSLVERLEVQPRAAELLVELSERILGRDRPPRSVLLIGPAGTGKSRALAALRDVLRPVGVLSFEVGELRAVVDLAAEVNEMDRGGVLLLDGLERMAVRSDELLQLADLLFPRAAACGEESTVAGATVVAAVTVDGVELTDGEPLGVQLAGDACTIGDDASSLLPLAGERGLPADVLARFEAFVPFRALDESAIELLLDRIDDDFLGRLGQDVRLELAPELRQQVVERALRLGGGAWGLKAVLAAMMSGFGPDEDTRTPALLHAL